jgi:hypothetical protein
MHDKPKQTVSLDETLTRLNAKLEAWQVRALFLGAQTSTNVRLSPLQLLGRILGPNPSLGTTAGGGQQQPDPVHGAVE